MCGISEEERTGKYISDDEKPAITLDEEVGDLVDDSFEDLERYHKTHGAFLRAKMNDPQCFSIRLRDREDDNKE